MLLNYYILYLLFIKLLIVPRDASSFDIHRLLLLLLACEREDFGFQQYAIRFLNFHKIMELMPKKAYLRSVHKPTTL
jgi:hypothetical protein